LKGVVGSRRLGWWLGRRCKKEKAVLIISSDGKGAVNDGMPGSEKGRNKPGPGQGSSGLQNAKNRSENRCALIQIQTAVEKEETSQLEEDFQVLQPRRRKGLGEKDGADAEKGVGVALGTRGKRRINLWKNQPCCGLLFLRR